MFARCYGNQGAKMVRFIPNFKKLYSNVSCHMQICKQRYFKSFKMAAVSWGEVTNYGEYSYDVS
jgi:hypothetical protein